LTDTRYPSAVAVERAIDVLFLLSERDSATATELSRALDLGKSAVHRILTALCRKGLVEQNHYSSRYSISWRVLALAHSIAGRADLTTLSLPYLIRLRDCTAETVTLHVRLGFDRICIAQVEGIHPLRWQMPIGSIRPLYAGAAGRVLLAHIPYELLQHYLATAERPKLTERSVTDRVELERELLKVREQGYAIGDQDVAIGVRGIAAPIFDRQGTIAAALAIAAPSSRCNMSQLRGWITDLRSAASAISLLLGFESVQETASVGSTYTSKDGSDSGPRTLSKKLDL
jgi:IclR family KDG regulon transcriptional repressor